MLFGLGMGWAQTNLDYFIVEAQRNSPLIQDQKNQSAAARIEVDRLKAVYTKSQVSLIGAYLFAPIISRDKGKSEVAWNAYVADRYSGYDLAASNGGMYQALINWNQPLFNGARAEAAERQVEIGASINENAIQLTLHDLQRFVTDQYILCLQDHKQMEYLETLIAIIRRQESEVNLLVSKGAAKKSDLSLLRIEERSQRTALSAARATYLKDLMDLRVLSGVTDTATVELDDIELQLVDNQNSISPFVERYRLDSLNLVAQQDWFETKYKPTVALYANSGLNAVYAPTILDRMGLSAGLNFTMTLTDGHQRKATEQKTQILMKTTSAYKDFFYRQNQVRKAQIRAQLKSIEERLTLTESQLIEYQDLLVLYNDELSQGEILLINYLTTLKNLSATNRDYVLLLTDRQRLINLYNYWSW